MAKRYEAKGGDYEDTGDNANEAKKGAPTPKKEAIASGERKDPSEPVGTPKTKKSSDKNNDASKQSGSKRKSDAKADDAEEDKAKDETKEKSKKPKTKSEPKPAAKGTRQQPKRGVKK